MLTKTLKAGGAALVATIGAVAVTTAVADTNPSSDPAVSATQSISVLDRAKSDRDQVPTDVQAVLAQGPRIESLDGARRAQLSDTEAGWVVPADDGLVCLATTTFLSCPSTDVFKARRVDVGYQWAIGQPTTLIGLATDGVSTVTATVDDGNDITVPVRDNTFRIETMRRPTGLVARTESGPVSVASPVSEAAYNNRAPAGGDPRDRVPEG